ncbi:MAG: hypothetical protein L6R42_006950 [Xanthoria sp. 1 TBL-2021]|nr:MAG: hypothetical protein L6R42_006950 [Xanthoria sp. 1 TBL-2021]
MKALREARKPFLNSVESFSSSGNPPTTDDVPSDDDGTSVSEAANSLSQTQIDEEDDENKGIIAIDFGTTFSGVAYCFTSNPSEVHLIKEWPGANGITYDKCPTILKYEEGGSLQWGYQLDRTVEGRVDAVKLLLDPSQPKPYYIPDVDIQAELQRLGKAPTAVATDYISAIFRHAVAKIESKYPQGFFQMLKKQYVMTVPAMWEEAAQDATLRAARNAGISPVKLVKEPEAAALFTLHHMGDKGLRVGDAFVICDAGGGTVDSISYEILSLKPFTLKELVKPEGNLAGSLMINRRFEDHIRIVMGEKEFLRVRETAAYAQAMQHFNDNIKPGFDTSQAGEHYVNFPKAGLKDNPAKGLSKDTITITRETIRELVRPIVNDITKLVGSQVMLAKMKRIEERHPKGGDITVTRTPPIRPESFLLNEDEQAIFLVGGFGANAFLLRTMEEAHPTIRVIQPNDAWSAIVRGAAMSQLRTETKVVSNVAPKHYGVRAISYTIHPTEDANQERHYHHLLGKNGVERMIWYIHQGDDLERNRPIEFDFYSAFSENPTHEQLFQQKYLLEWGGEQAPLHPKAGMKTNCTLRADLSGVPKDHFDKKERRLLDGALIKWWELRYKLVVEIQSGPMLFSISSRGKQYGSVTTEY